MSNQQARIEAIAQRIMRLMNEGSSYHVALSSVICDTHAEPSEWVVVINRVEELRGSSTYWLLRHRRTNAYFDGTNFSAYEETKAKRFTTKPDLQVVRLAWAADIELVERVN